MPGTLEGTLVVDFTRVFAGPFATQILGDLGADVIKVERLDGGDEARDYGVEDPSRTPGPPFLAMNRNKRSLAVDVTTPAGREIAERLLTRADVAIHNFRNGVMEKLGLGYDRISEMNPGVVYCSISGYGSVGPLRQKAANDLAMQAYSGLLSITGEPGRPPVRVPTSVCDLTAGMFAVIGILSALLQRRATGVGQAVETSLLEGQLNSLNHFFVDYWLNGTIPQPMGTANKLGLPNQAFPTSDGWVTIASPNDRQWQRCCRALEIEDVATEERFATLAARYAHREELVEAVSEATRKYTTRECVSRLEKAGVSSAPVNTIPQVVREAQLEALNAIVEMPVRGLGPVKLVMSPLRFSNATVTARIPPPGLGEQSLEVLASLGYTRTDVERMRQEGTIGGIGA